MTKSMAESETSIARLMASAPPLIADSLTPMSGMPPTASTAILRKRELKEVRDDFDARASRFCSIP